MNWWNNGEFKDQLNLDTLQFNTLAEMFAADATTPKRANTCRRTAALSAREPRLSAGTRDGHTAGASATISTPMDSSPRSRASACT